MGSVARTGIVLWGWMGQRQYRSYVGMYEGGRGGDKN